MSQTSRFRRRPADLRQLVAAAARANDQLDRRPGPPSCSWRKRGTQKEALGRSKGGFTTKVHLIANAAGLPVRAEITGGEASDRKGFDLLVDEDLPKSKVMIADKGYDSDHVRDIIAASAATLVIPARSNRKRPVEIDRMAYRLRNRIGCAINKLKCSRRFATRCDKTAASFFGFTNLIAARISYRSLSTRPSVARMGIEKQQSSPFDIVFALTRHQRPGRV
jgi:transposase